jgi:hypothetical protein
MGYVHVQSKFSSENECGFNRVFRHFALFEREDFNESGSYNLLQT